MDNLMARPQGAVPAQIVGRGAAACHAPVAIPVEVLTAAGSWAKGFELLRFEDDGTALVRSGHTGNSRRLPMDHWREPVNWGQILAAFPEIKGIHPALEPLPMGLRADFLALEVSIGDQGMQSPVIVDAEGLLIDGRKRVLACHRTGHQLLIAPFMPAGANGIRRLTPPAGCTAQSIGEEVRL